ncbi:MAG: PQQ-binding-like beta-propeller repeat protein [Halobacteriota archaeon]
MRAYKSLSFSVVIILIIVLFACAVPAAAQTDTMQFRYNATHPGDYSPVAGSVQPNNQLKWNYTTVTGAWFYSSPAVANGVVYVGSEDGNVYAIGNESMSTPITLTAAPPSTASVNQNFTINGTLTNATLGTPIAGATITLKNCTDNHVEQAAKV